jgi:hypothetical protein
VKRLPKEREVTRIYKWKPFASRPIERPKNRWEDDMSRDLQTMKIKNWIKSVLNIDLWKIIFERTKTYIFVAFIKKKKKNPTAGHGCLSVVIVVCCQVDR